MKLMRCNSSTGNASWAVGYLLRQEETGIIMTTDIMQDEDFGVAIKQLQADQNDAFYGGKMRMSLELRQRRTELLESASENFQFCGTRDVRNLASLIHDMDLTMMFNREGRHFKMMTEPIPLPDADDPEAVAKILRSAEAVRDLFPKHLPGIITIHTKGDKTPISIEEAVRLRKNIHIQALLATKTFENGAWSSPYQPLAPKKGDDHLIAELAEKVEQAVTDVMGKSFKKHTQVVIEDNGTRSRVAVDPNRPLRAEYSAAAAAIIGRHTNEQLHNLPLESIKNPCVRQEIRQVLAIDDYDRKQREDRIQATQVDRFKELLTAVERSMPSITSLPPELSVPSTSFTAFITDYEERRDYAAAVRQQISLVAAGAPDKQTEKPRTMVRQQHEPVPDRRSKEARDSELLERAMKLTERRRSKTHRVFNR